MSGEVGSNTGTETARPKLELNAMSMDASLPPELWLRVFNTFRPSLLLPGDGTNAREPLQYVTLTCRMFRNLAQSILYHRIVLLFPTGYQDRGRWSRRVEGILEMLKLREECRWWIRELTLRGPSSEQKLPDDPDWLPAEQILLLSQAVEDLNLEVRQFRPESLRHIWSLLNLGRFTLQLAEGYDCPDQARLGELPPRSSSSLTRLTLVNGTGNTSSLSSSAHFLRLPSVSAVAADAGLLYDVLQSPTDPSKFSHLQTLNFWISEDRCAPCISFILTSCPNVRRLSLFDRTAFVRWEEVSVPSLPLLPLEQLKCPLPLTRKLVPGRPVERITLDLTWETEEEASDFDLAPLSQGSVPVTYMELHQAAWTAERLQSLSEILPRLEELVVYYKSGCEYMSILEDMAGSSDKCWPNLRNIEVNNVEDILGTPELGLWRMLRIARSAGEHMELLERLKKRFDSLETARIQGIRYKLKNSCFFPM